MKKFRVFFTVYGTATAVVEAESKDEAYTIAKNEYEEGPISICHQCSHEISDPAYGEITDVVEI